jgi:hypothetical protein
MRPLERELRGLAADVAWPPAPDVTRAVAARLGAEPPATSRWWRRRPILAVALAALLAAVVATLAVPPARTAVLRWLGIGSVRIERVEELPATLPAGPLPGQQVSLTEARAAVSFDLLEPPPALGPPGRILLRRREGIVTYVWGTPSTPRLAVTQLPGGPAPWLVGKLIPPGTGVQRLSVGGKPAIWIDGPHEIAVLDPERDEPLLDRARLAGNTLLVDRGTVTLRLEGRFTLAQAQRLARAFS